MHCSEAACDDVGMVWLLVFFCRPEQALGEGQDNTKGADLTETAADVVANSNGRDPVGVATAEEEIVDGKGGGSKSRSVTPGKGRRSLSSSPQKQK